jgi:hypothetical protein
MNLALRFAAFAMLKRALDFAQEGYRTLETGREKRSSVELESKTRSVSSVVSSYIEAILEPIKAVFGVIHEYCRRASLSRHM